MRRRRRQRRQERLREGTRHRGPSPGGGGSGEGISPAQEEEEEEEDGDEVPVPSFGEAMAYFAMVKRYLTSFPIDDRVQSHILHLEHDLVHVTRKNHARQAGMRGLGHQS